MKKKDQFIHICNEEWDEFTAEITVRSNDDDCACQTAKISLPDLKAVLDHVQSKVTKRNDFDLDNSDSDDDNNYDNIQNLDTSNGTLYEFSNLDNDKNVSVDTLFPEKDKTILFKIDVDGGEMDVLNGMKNTAINNNCYFVIETHTKQL